MPADDMEHRLRLEQWGTRFSERDAELAYLQWQFDRTFAAARAALVAGTAFGVAVQLAALVLQIPGLLAWVGPMALVYVVIAGQFVTHARRRARPFMIASAVALSTEAVVTIGMAIDLDLASLDQGVAMVGIAITLAFWLGASAGDRLALGSTTAFLVAAGVARTVAWSRGEASTAGLVFELVTLVFSCVAVVLIVANTERSNRQAYRQERIIESQRETIARQESLLRKELSHQVAERSRELGNVLGRADVTLDVRRLAIGERFAERYKIARALGAGGMGAVYEVERVTDAARLALKVVTGEVSGPSAARFAREAEIGARVRHPNLIAIVDVGVASGVPYLVMELVPGGSLEAQRARFGDAAWALPILKQIAEGLAALHDAGVVHRDLKPANVLLDAGRARISDFGISRLGAIDDDARAVDASAETHAAAPKKSADLTGTGVVMGTPLYMAPEGARSARALDASADVFAFGVLAHEMLAGKPPFAVPAFVLAMAEQPIPAPPPLPDARVPVPFREAITSALAGDPTGRPRIRAILAALG